MKMNDQGSNELVKQLRELAECTEDEAITALYDAENSLEKAVELLLDSCKTGNDRQWQVSGGKRSKGKDKLIKINPPAVATKTTEPVSNGSFRSKGSTKIEKVVKNEKTEKTSPTRDDKILSDVPCGKGRSRESESWDPFKDYGGWTGECIEIINSESKLSCDDAADSFPPGLLDESVASSSSTVTDADPIEQPEITESVTFLTKPWTSKPPNAFTRLPDAPVYFVPGIVPSGSLRHTVRIGSVVIPDAASCSSPVVNDHHSHPAIPTSQAILRPSATEEVCLSHEKTPPQPSQLKENLSREADLARSQPVEESVGATFESERSKILDKNSVEHLLHESYRSRINQDLSKISIRDQRNQKTLPDVSGSQTTSTQAQRLHGHDHHYDKAHNQAPSAVGQTGQLPAGVPQFVGHFTHPYQMFELPNNPGNASMIDMEQLQMMQNQRMMYDMQTHQQAASTTAQNQAPSVDAIPVSKHISNIPGNIGHNNNLGTNVRPDMLAQAMSHSAPMMPVNHPFPYPGLFLMNGFPGPYVNQPHATQEEQNSTHAGPPITQHTGAQGFVSKQSTSGGNAYDELMDMRFPEHLKSAPFKDAVTPNYGTFPGQHSADVGVPKLSGVTNSGSQLPPGYNSGSGPTQVFSNMSFLMSPAMASAILAAVSRSNNTMPTGQVNPVTGQSQIHMNSSTSQAMGGMGPGTSMTHHPQRPGMARQH